MSNIKTAIPINNSASMLADDQRSRADILFNPSMDNIYSHIIKVIDNPWVIRAYNLLDNDSVNLLQVSDDGNYESVVFLNSKPVRLKSTNTILVIDIPGRYKFHLEASPGYVAVIANEYAISHWTCGLIHSVL